VLQEIISTSANATDGTSFLSIFKAYDIVLKARDIDPAKDRVYFKFLLKLARVQGATWTDKYNNILKVPYPHFGASLTIGTEYRYSTTPVFSPYTTTILLPSTTPSPTATPHIASLAHIE
jgi:hypothetical protein